MLDKLCLDRDIGRVGGLIMGLPINYGKDKRLELLVIMTKKWHWLRPAFTKQMT